MQFMERCILLAILVGRKVHKSFTTAIIILRYERHYLNSIVLSKFGNQSFCTSCLPGGGVQ
jgi:hypothetical protein